MAHINGRSNPERRKLEREVVALIPRLKVYALSLTRDKDASEDLIQGSLLLALRGLESFQTGTNLNAWIFRIMRNHFISGLRSSRAKNETSWNPDIERTATSRIAESEADANLDLHSLLLYLACLEKNQSDALVAVGYLGLSYEDVAERLKTTIGTMKSRVSRARKELRLLMEDGELRKVDVSGLKIASRGVPQSHPYFPIAKAYEELYEASEGISKNSNGSTPPLRTSVSESERLWQELVASGGADGDPEDLSRLMQGHSDDL